MLEIQKVDRAATRCKYPCRERPGNAIEQVKVMTALLDQRAPRVLSKLVPLIDLGQKRRAVLAETYRMNRAQLPSGDCTQGELILGLETVLHAHLDWRGIVLAPLGEVQGVLQSGRHRLFQKHGFPRGCHLIEHRPVGKVGGANE